MIALFENAAPGEGAPPPPPRRRPPTPSLLVEVESLRDRVTLLEAALWHFATHTGCDLESMPDPLRPRLLVLADSAGVAE